MPVRPIPGVHGARPIGRRHEPSPRAAGVLAGHLDPHLSRPPCLATFVTASTAVRKVATSTAAGSAASSGTDRSRLRPASVVRPSRWSLSAPARPSSSSAGGRRPSTRSRRLVMTCDEAALALPRYLVVFGSVLQPHDGRVEVEPQAGQQGSEPVVQVAAEPAPLLLARRRPADAVASSRSAVSASARTDPATMWASVARICRSSSAIGLDTVTAARRPGRRRTPRPGRAATSRHGRPVRRTRPAPGRHVARRRRASAASRRSPARGSPRRWRARRRCARPSAG